MYSNNFKNEIDEQTERESIAIKTMNRDRVRNHNRRPITKNRLTYTQALSTARWDTLVRKAIDRELNSKISL